MADLRDRSGISDSQLSWWLYRNAPKPAGCVVIAEAFGVPLWQVYEAAGYPGDPWHGWSQDDPGREILRMVADMTFEERATLLDELRRRDGQA